jgi:hypothetical protein
MLGNSCEAEPVAASQEGLRCLELDGVNNISSVTFGIPGAVCMESGYKEEFIWAAYSGESSFETPACRDISLGAEEVNWVEFSELAVAE